MGVGAAIRTAFTYAVEHGFDVIVVMAGNNKDFPEHITNLIDPIAGRVVKTLAGHPSPIRCVAFSPDGKLIAFGGADNLVRAIDTTTGQQVLQNGAHSDWVLDTGFSPDMSTGVTFGLKLPTGDSTYPNFDPDTEIGTGSTDLLLGAFHRGRLTEDGKAGYFARAQWQTPLHHKTSYRPGQELIGVVGAYARGWSFGEHLAVTPILQLTAAYRGHDGGTDGHPEDTGSTRVLVSPGVEVHLNKVRIYAEAGFSVHDNVSGNQLVSRRNFKLTAFYSF